MRELSVLQVQSAVKSLFTEICFRYPDDVKKQLEESMKKETGRAQSVLSLLLENEQCAKENRIPLCQDTGLAVVFIKIGQEVHFTDGLLEEAIHQGVREAYQQAYLRYSCVNDPLFERINTNDNTPAMIHYEIVGGNQVEIQVMAKGFGSENTSGVRMLKPAQGVNGVKEFVLDVVRQAGPNACPPMTVGVGIGGTMDVAAWLAKKALIRTNKQQDPRYATLEKELREELNTLNIGPAGLGGKTTALDVHVEYAPTHIAGLPCAVNINCHANRKGSVIL
ncbi:MAG: fumarate hydratase [Erysipelotrichaceae bacterium]|nr:fumarate hydratase [Erysipelotrichaceae bacterium]